MLIYKWGCIVHGRGAGNGNTNGYVGASMASLTALLLLIVLYHEARAEAHELRNAPAARQPPFATFLSPRSEHSRRRRALGRQPTYTMVVYTVTLFDQTYSDHCLM